MEHVMIIKIDFDGDVRRINISLAEDAPSMEKLQEIRTAVAQGFDMEESLLPVLKYKDEEGDICTLVEASVEDLLELSNSGTMRLLASKTSVAPPKEDAAHKMSGPPSTLVQSEVIASSTDDATNDSDAAIGSSAQEAATDDIHHDEAVSNASDRHMEADSFPHSDESVSAAGRQSEEEPPVPSTETQVPPTEDTQGVAELTAMGFTKEQAVFGLECAKGSVEGAVEYLVHGKQQEPQQQQQQGPPPRRTSLETIESKVRSLPGNVMEQLQKLRGQFHQIVANVKQHKGHEDVHSSESESLQSLQATLKAMQARLGDLRELVQAALKNATVQLDAEFEERLRKVEAEIADAHRFLTETLDTLLKNNEAAAKDGAAVAMETMDAVVTAAVDAALAAMATVDEILFVDTGCAAASSAHGVPSNGSDPGTHDAPANTTSGAASSTQETSQQQGVRSATKMDYAQVFLSKSISALRAGLVRTVSPSRGPLLTSESATADTSTNHTAAAAATGATDGYTKPATATAEDAFLLAEDANGEKEA